MTKKLYDLDAYAVEFSAKVLSSEKSDDDTYIITLDQTLFFPEEGGQTPDKGIIWNEDKKVEVLDVQIKDNIIFHKVSGKMDAGMPVNGKIDFTHRYNNMQQHTGEHIFSGFAHSLYGCTNVGFHLSDSIVTMDYDVQLEKEQIEDIERKVNEAIAKNIEVICEYPSKERLAEMDYRSKIELTGDVRIVTIPGVDVCACCAPHVRTTGEVGILKVQFAQNYKGGTRISILCGLRAFDNYKLVHDQIASTAHFLSVKHEEVYDTVCKLLNERNELLGRLKDAQAEVMNMQIEAIDSDAENACIFVDGIDNIVARNAVNSMMLAHSGFSAVFIGNDNEGYAFIIGSKNADCREVLKKMQESLSCRGGGKPEMVQGSVKGSKKDIKKFF